MITWVVTEHLPKDLAENLAGFGDRETRRVLVQDYEVRYEISESKIYVLRVFHTRAHR